MSDTLKPAHHGREHCPDGEDPIPCLFIPKLIWGRAVAEGDSIPDNTSTFLDVSSATSVAADQTDIEAYDDGFGLTGLQVNTQGFWLLTYHLVWTSASFVGNNWLYIEHNNPLDFLPFSPNGPDGWPKFITVEMRILSVPNVLSMVAFQNSGLTETVGRAVLYATFRGEL